MVHVKRGVISPSACRIPDDLLAFLNKKANRLAAVHTQLSPTQKARNRSLIFEKADNVQGSEMFRAMFQDFLQSGGAAFAPEDD